MPDPRVAILMGSQSDWPVMQSAEQALEKLGIGSDARVISAHRTPQRLTSYLADAEARGIEVIICGAGAAAHLAGVTGTVRRRLRRVRWDSQGLLFDGASGDPGRATGGANGL